MKKILLKRFAQLTAALSVAVSFAEAQEVEVSAGGEIVSSYIWRGQELGGVSIQPAASVSVAGFSFSAWGSVGFDRSDTKEFDFTIGYNARGFSAAVTDYWFDTAEYYFDYAAHTTAHIYEVTFGYDFGPAAIAWNTYFAGADYLKADGGRAYSTYIEARAPFRLGAFDLNVQLGLTPWEGVYSDKLNIVMLGIAVEKQLRFTEICAIPAFTKITCNPYERQCYFVFGVRI
jgi:hypothetical protein